MLDVNPQDYDIVLKIKEENDIAVSRQMAKSFAQKNNFSLADVTKIATAVSELARNIYRYAKEGYIYIRKKQDLIKLYPLKFLRATEVRG